jgi:hypothetical protein
MTLNLPLAIATKEPHPIHRMPLMPAVPSPLTCTTRGAAAPHP